MTSSLTREEMLARAKENVKALRLASRQHAFADARSEILADLQIAEFALSCLESEPVAWLLSGGGAKNMVSFDSGNAYADPLREVTPLFTSPQPAPVVPDEIRDGYDEILESGVVDSLTRSESYAAGLNACRAAMLNDSTNIDSANSPEIPEGWVDCSDRMPEDEQEVITHDIFGYRYVSFFDEHSGHFFNRLDGSSVDCVERVLVSHWMALPAAPQEVTSASPIKK